MAAPTASVVPQHGQLEDATVWGPVVSVVVIAIANLIAYAGNENSWIFKHWLGPLRLPHLLFMSNRADCVGRHARPKTYWAFDLIDPAHLVYSNCLNTCMLLVLHILTVLYWVATVIVDVVIDYYRVWCDEPSCNRRHGAYGEWASFLTNWSISILGISGIIAFANTARYLRRVCHQQKALRRQQHQQQYAQPHVAGNSSSAAPARPAVHSVGINLSPAALEIPNGNLRDGRMVSTAQSPPRSMDQCLPSDSTRTPTQHPHKQHSAGAADDETYDAEPNQAVQMVHLPQQPGAHSAAAETASMPGCCRSQKSKKAVFGARVGSLRHPGAPDTVVVIGAGSNCSSAEGCNCRDELQHKWDWLSCAHCLVMETATTAAFFVSFWYWVGIVGIAKSGFEIDGGTLLAHAGNVVIAFLQVVLTRLPIVSYHFQVLLWYATLYMIFLWIFGGVTDIWRYSLNWQRTGPAVAFIIIPVLTFIMFTLWYLAAVARERMLFAGGSCRAKRRMEQQQQQQHRDRVSAVGVHTSAAHPPDNVTDTV